MVDWYRPQTRPHGLTVEEYAALPRLLRIRELEYRVNRPGFRVRAVTLVTSLLDPIAYPAAELADLYRRRWEVETNLAHLKTTLGMDVLKCHSEEGVLKELAVFAIVYNLVRAVMWEAGRRQDVPPDRIRFIDALRWLSSSPPGTPLPRLIVNPIRPDRIEPRSQKRRAKKVPVHDPTPTSPPRRDSPANTCDLTSWHSGRAWIRCRSPQRLSITGVAFGSLLPGIVAGVFQSADMWPTRLRRFWCLTPVEVQMWLGIGQVPGRRGDADRIRDINELAAFGVRAPRAIAVLIGCLSDPSAPVREAARVALAQIGTAQASEDSR